MDNIFTATKFFSNSGNRPEDFYYKYNAAGSKRYYSRITGKPIAKDNIAVDVNLIPEYSTGDTAELLKLRDGYNREIQRLQDKVEEINNKLSKLNIGNEEEIIKEKEIQEEKDRKRKEEYKKEQDDFIRKIFEDFVKKQPPPPKKSTPPNNLPKLGLKTRKEWRGWLLANHPDKGGKDLDLYQQVIIEGRDREW